MDINVQVHAMTSNDFTDEDVIDKLQVAYNACSAIYGSAIPLTSGTVGSTVIVVSDDDRDLGMAIALLAEAKLIEGRRIVNARLDPSIVIRTTEELFTREMRNMLLVADATDDDEVDEGIMWDASLPTKNWSL